ncbi:amino acid ABC transporter permease [Nocardioides sp. cx-169]|uniref:amino acid ABC transporter permease n=1 Tax=Nocardioides sp. cx-169 TaxID=2899080 RepID=UPI001E29325B|nr:amino acid ABC transporter permease [Nocardioides sp. cx-169]MCD4532540.1 amino acid ABC transporter permease [Nocardioides sp. cx-169]
MDVIVDNVDRVALAFGYTLLLFVIGGIISLVLGTALAAMRVGPIAVLSRGAALYVTLVRNTPLLIVIFFFRYAGPKVGLSWNFVDVQIGDIDLNNVFTACAVGIGIYTAAFVCEALRSGINAVPLGQAEAARAIGLPFAGVMREVVLPQAFRASVPPMASVQIALLKNTTVAGAVGVAEAFARMKGLTNDYATARTEIFLAFAIFFVVLVEILSFFANRLERRWRIA